MKKRLIKSMLVFVILCLSYGLVYANSMQLIYDGISHSYEYEPISLYIDGDRIVTTVMPPIQFDGAVVVPAREVFSTTGATVEWRPSEQSVYVHNDVNLIVLRINSNEAWVNGEIRTLNMPAKLINDKVMIPIRFISETLGYTVEWSQSERTIRITTEAVKNNPVADQEEINKEDSSEENSGENNNEVFDSITESNQKVIVIDAGHGAHDPGAQYGDLLEKDLTLAMSQAVAEKIRSESDITVYTTRDDDSYLALLERSEFSNSINPDLFISIHVNSVDNNTTASGIETYYTEKEDIRNKVFATMVQEALIDEFGTRNRGVKTNTFVVTKYTNAPAVLIEIGFITNESDRAMMTAPDFTQRYAEAVYGSIMAYYQAGYHLQ